MKPEEKFEELCRMLGGKVRQKPWEPKNILFCYNEEAAYDMFAGLIHGDWLIINATPHPIKFTDDTTLPPSDILAELLRAETVREEAFTEDNMMFVRTKYKKMKKGKELVDWARKKEKVLLVSSVISVEAYGYPVVSPVIPPELQRLPPPERKASKNVWNTKVPSLLWAAPLREEEE